MVWTNPRQLWGLVKESVTGWSDDYASSMGAAIAYYTLFSVAPLLIIVIGVAGLVFGHDAARGAIFEQIGGVVGAKGASAIEGLVRSESQTGTGTIATVVGIVTLLIGATSVFGELQSDLDRVWNVPQSEKPSGIWNTLRTRLLSFGLVLAMGFLLTVSLVLSAGLSALGKYYGGLFGDAGWLLQVANFVVSFLVITGLFALIYKFLPSAKIGWHDVWIGAAVTALLFDIGRYLIGLYLGRSSVVSGFGAAGSLVLVIVWVYYSAQIFLLGAEFTRAYAHRYGSRRNAAATTQDAAGHPSADERTDRRAKKRPPELRARNPDIVLAHRAPSSHGSDAVVVEKTRAESVSGTTSPSDNDDLPVASDDEIVHIVAEGRDPATRVARAADRHPKLSLAIVAVALAAASFVVEAVQRRRAAAR